VAMTLPTGKLLAEVPGNEEGCAGAVSGGGCGDEAPPPRGGLAHEDINETDTADEAVATVPSGAVGVGAVPSGDAVAAA